MGVAAPASRAAGFSGRRCLVRLLPSVPPCRHNTSNLCGSCTTQNVCRKRCCMCVSHTVSSEWVFLLLLYCCVPSNLDLFTVLLMLLAISLYYMHITCTGNLSDCAFEPQV